VGSHGSGEGSLASSVAFAISSGAVIGSMSTRPLPAFVFKNKTHNPLKSNTILFISPETLPKPSTNTPRHPRLREPLPHLRAFVTSCETAPTPFHSKHLKQTLKKNHNPTPL
jgi:hypothetical protein